MKCCLGFRAKPDFFFEAGEPSGLRCLLEDERGARVAGFITKRVFDFRRPAVPPFQRFPEHLLPAVIQQFQEKLPQALINGSLNLLATTFIELCCIDLKRW